jgi:phage head maturation protease
MALWDRLSGWANRQAGPSAPVAARSVTDTPKWARPLNFTIDIAPEIAAAWAGTGVPAAKVSRDMALSVPAVLRVRNLICATIGTLEFWEMTDPGNVLQPNDLLAQPENDTARSITYTMLAEDLLFEERGWFRITELNEQGWPSKVARLEPRSVNVRRNGRVYVNSTTGQTQGQAWEWVQDSELIRVDSPCPGLLTYGAATIRDAVALAAAVSRNMQNPIPLGYLSPRENPGEDLEDPPNVEEIVDEFEDSIGRRAFPYVNGALQVTKLAWSPAELQMNETRDAIILEIARLGGVDPEELGVSTTSRTYANSEQRRLDLIDFTIKAFVTAIQERLSMNDVTFPGRKVRAQYEGFLRSDTKTRMETYKIGREVGVYDDKRIARIEEIPSAKMPAPVVPQPSTEEVQNMRTPVRAVGFSDTSDPISFVFNEDDVRASFKADSAKRTITGLAIPWNRVARSIGYQWKFAPGSLHWADSKRVKLDMDHIDGSEMGFAASLVNGPDGLMSSFKVARGQSGDDALMLAEDGVKDGLSVWVTFDGEADGWTADPADERVRLVHSATLRKVALTAIPAFDDARVLSVAASQKGNTVTAPPITPEPQAFDAAAFTAAFTAGFGPEMAKAIGEALKPVIEALPQPQGRPVVPAGKAVVTREAPVYQMNGSGPSFVRDAWKARTENDHEARERLAKFQQQTADTAKEAMQEDPAFAINTGNASGLIPPGFRPDLYVTQLIKGRPMVMGISRGTIQDASPFNIPAYVSSTGATATHVEGVNPSQGSLVIGTITVSPGAISGTYKITREMADSSNPAVDAIATQAMAESYSQQTEGIVYTELNGANGVGGTITAGFVPSGAQVSAVTGSAGGVAAGGDELLAGVRQATAVYPFRRFAALDFAYMSMEATQAFAGAVDTTGRPLLPYVGPYNSVGTSRPNQAGYLVDGQVYEPAWGMTGNAAGDADIIAGAKPDVWCWESPTLMFRFEERDGPANIDLALFGYFTCKVLRPVGLVGVRYTVTP